MRQEETKNFGDLLCLKVQSSPNSVTKALCPIFCNQVLQTDKMKYIPKVRFFEASKIKYPELHSDKVTESPKRNVKRFSVLSFSCIPKCRHFPSIIHQN